VQWRGLDPPASTSRQMALKCAQASPRCKPLQAQSIACKNAPALKHGSPFGRSAWCGRRFVVHPLLASADSAPAISSDPEQQPDTSASNKASAWDRIRNWIIGGPLDKERLKSLGVGAIISYGWAPVFRNCHPCLPPFSVQDTHTVRIRWDRHHLSLPPTC
jgi:hypothetical protein